MLEILKEVENEALAKSDGDYFHQDVTYQLLMKLEVIEEDVTANLKIAAKAKVYGFSSGIV